MTNKNILSMVSVIAVVLVASTAFAGKGRGRICLGLWGFSEKTRSRIARNIGLAPDAAAPWFDASFPQNAAA